MFLHSLLCLNASSLLYSVSRNVDAATVDISRLLGRLNSVLVEVLRLLLAIMVSIL